MTGGRFSRLHAPLNLKQDMLECPATTSGITSREEAMNEKQSVTDMFAELAKQIKLPQPDVNALIDIHRKNIEAIGRSATALSEGGKAIAAKQQEIFADVLRETKAMISEFRPPGNPQEIVAKQAEFARKAFDATVKNMRDVAELIQKSNAEAPKIILDRMRESLAEARAAIEKK